jgi:GntR family transcriptional repressor for pyruvate dehydrogenase complex
MVGEEILPLIGNQGRLVDRVAQEVERLILDGVLEAGTKLPPQRELAEQIGVSRTVIREAMQILETKGLLESRHGFGTLIRQVSPDQFTQSMSWLLRSTKISLDDLHQVRSILEVENVRLAAVNATPEGVQTLRRILEEMDSAQADLHLFAEKDAEFHTALAQMTDNPLLTVLIDAIRDLIQEVRLSISRNPELKAMVMPDHYAILEQVEAKDSEGACTAMRIHLEHARRMQELFLEQGDKHYESIG